MIDVKTKGAVGDGFHDDTAAFAAALVESHEVYAPTGCYLIDSLRLGHCRIVGDGMGMTTLRHLPSAVAPMLRTIIPTDVAIRDMTIDGNNLTNRNIATVDLFGRMVDIERMEFANTVKAGLRLRSCTISTNIYHSLFHRMALHTGITNQETCAVLVGKEIAGDGVVCFTDSIISMPVPTSPGNSVAGFVASPQPQFQQRVIVKHSTFLNLGQDVAGNVIAPVQIYRNGAGSIIDGNTVAGSCWGGIKMQNSDDGKIINNVLEGEAMVGPTGSAAILVQSRGQNPPPCRGLYIAGNTVRNRPNTPGCYIEWDQSSGIEDARLIGNGIYGTKSGYTLKPLTGVAEMVGNHAQDCRTPITIQARPGSRLVEVGNSWN